MAWYTVMENHWAGADGFWRPSDAFGGDVLGDGHAKKCAKSAAKVYWDRLTPGAGGVGCGRCGSPRWAGGGRGDRSKQGQAQRAKCAPRTGQTFAQSGQKTAGLTPKEKHR
jgi:hypothetical protein